MIRSEHIARVSRCLDELLVLQPAAQQQWLVSHAAIEGEANVMLLRQLLRMRQCPMSRQFLESFPELGPDPERVDTANSARVGDKVGSYRLIRIAGQGGAATVWLAECSGATNRRQVALKLPHDGPGRSSAELVKEEAAILARLEHPGIARFLDVGVDQSGRAYMAMEFIEGQTIRKHCVRHRLPLVDRVQLIVHVAQAVVFANQLGIIHSDIKPDNVVVDGSSRTRLLDFGIARQVGVAHSARLGRSESGGRLLSPCYAAPEQLAGESVTAATDVYGLGMLAFEVLTGRPPFGVGEAEPLSRMGVERRLLRSDLGLPSRQARDPGFRDQLKGKLDTIVSRATRKCPRERYSTAEAMAKDLCRWLGNRAASRPSTQTSTDRLGPELPNSREWLEFRSARVLPMWRSTGVGT